MPRPEKNNADYFSHDADMRNDDKIKAVRKKFGVLGYAIYNMLLEYIANKEFWTIEYTPLNLELMAGDFDADTEVIKSIIDYFIILDLFQMDGPFLRCKKLEARLAVVKEKRDRAKEQAKDQQRSSGRFCKNNTGEPDISVTETPQSKVKESKALTHTEVDEGILKAVCGIFGKEYQSPENRMTGEANWFRDIENQSLILQTSYPDSSEAIKQIKAYQKYCKMKDRKMIGTAYKVADTVLSSDWVNLLGERAPPLADKFKDAEWDKGLLTMPAWEERYAFKLKNDEEFKKHFGYGKLQVSKSMGG